MKSLYAKVNIYFGALSMKKNPIISDVKKEKAFKWKPETTTTTKEKKKEKKKDA